jgi:hypothetical protein
MAEIDPEDGFLTRWSRRKAHVRQGQPVPAAAPLPVAPTAPPAPPEASAAPRPAEPGLAEAAAPEPQPTLDDVAQLTPTSDFRRFVAPQVGADVRNAALKRLFADPHFNVMDGLDVYIDDYSKPSPLSKAELAMMVGAKFLKLVDDPDEKRTTEAAAPSAPTDGGATAATPGPETADPTPPHDDHADLQLQPDHDPGRESPGHGTG